MPNMPAFTALHNMSRKAGPEMRAYTIELERLLRVAMTNDASRVGASSSRGSRGGNSNASSANDYIRVDTWNLNSVKQVEKKVAVTRIDMGLNGELFLKDQETEVVEIAS